MDDNVEEFRGEYNKTFFMLHYIIEF